MTCWSPVALARHRIHLRHLPAGDKNYEFFHYLHEIGHVLGLHHEHQRPDPDLIDCPIFIPDRGTHGSTRFLQIHSEYIVMNFFVLSAR
ncbi:hypothetical protein BU23DRAFT_562062 [Bimuria novae-zelandiae CBS 107.79]|uniref:Peptidase M12A domain-containing protein n=1 Tax=Bimuria novae-zelandiae CBS 107.79 TaxID=1447943 RepID=A0A6A5UMX6_9PLEO|nr:hypothetical protein BU23DRAFT_562062 [Bimuria novae-zelandiae CBS 107.79]